jgi:predicted GNAT family acetyltransferase
MLILTDFYNHTAQQLYRKLGYEHYDIALVKKLR